MIPKSRPLVCVAIHGPHDVGVVEDRLKVIVLIPITGGKVIGIDGWGHIIEFCRAQVDEERPIAERVPDGSLPSVTAQEESRSSAAAPAPAPWVGPPPAPLADDPIPPVVTPVAAFCVVVLVAPDPPAPPAPVVGLDPLAPMGSEAPRKPP